ncbi:hypothetical protein D5086_033618 [Populus alba]|uniref:Uncharacterized protein n=1 Tax=Populus alba TaxID=43335 RepID=A0ACC4AHB2_POPAL
MKLLLIFISILLIQAFVGNSILSNAASSSVTIVVIYAQGDAGHRQERRYATEHAKLAATDAGVFHQDRKIEREILERQFKVTVLGTELWHGVLYLSAVKNLEGTAMKGFFFHLHVHSKFTSYMTMEEYCYSRYLVSPLSTEIKYRASLHASHVFLSSLLEVVHSICAVDCIAHFLGEEWEVQYPRVTFDGRAMGRQDQHQVQL